MDYRGSFWKGGSLGSLGLGRRGAKWVPPVLRNSQLRITDKIDGVGAYWTQGWIMPALEFWFFMVWFSLFANGVVTFLKSPISSSCKTEYPSSEKKQLLLSSRTFMFIFSNTLPANRQLVRIASAVSQTEPSPSPKVFSHHSLSPILLIILAPEEETFSAMHLNNK